jgi:serum/glucocorticoid-regulated kinase 2
LLNNSKKIVLIFIYLETILLSALVNKYNHLNKKQERIILVTTKNIYNILPAGGFNDFISTLFSGVRFKRKISYNTITAITLSRFGPEFVIHIAK